MRGRLIAILVLAALVAGCGDDGAEPTTTTTVAPTTTVAATTTTTSQAPATTTTEALLEAVEFTGHTSCGQFRETWSGPALADDVPGTSVESSTDCVYTMSDERASGTGPVTVSVALSLDGDTRVGVISGTAVISNEGGTWESTIWGTTTWTLTDQGHVHVMDSEGLGTGDYAGLRLLIHQEGIEFPWTTTGRIEPAE